MIAISRKQLEYLAELVQRVSIRVSEGDIPHESIRKDLGDLFELECKLRQASKSNSAYLSIERG